MSGKPPSPSPQTRGALGIETDTEILPRLLALRVLLPYAQKHKKQSGKGKKTHWPKADEAIQTQLHQYPTPLPSEQRGFFQALVYGTLRHWGPLTWRLSQLSHFPLDRLEPTVEILLRLGLYQLDLMDHVPAYAAVNTTVTLAENQGIPKKTQGFINGLLRNASRAPMTSPNWAMEEVPHMGLPQWLYERWEKRLTPEELRGWVGHIRSPQPLSLWVNPNRIGLIAYQDMLTANRVKWQSDKTFPPLCLSLPESWGSPKQLPGFDEGLFLVQNPNAAQVVIFLDPQPGETIVDLCAAPGGKTCQIAAAIGPNGRLYAVDVSQKRLQRVRENLDRLGLMGEAIELVEGDGTRWTPEAGLLADRVLIDAPCSGLGTLSKNPEILLRLEKEEALTLYSTQQLALLTHGATLVRPEGHLVYSTCSTEPDENRGVIDQFLNQSPGWTLVLEQSLPISTWGEGFYMARLQAPPAP